MPTVMRNISINCEIFHKLPATAWRLHRVALFAGGLSFPTARFAIVCATCVGMSGWCLCPK